MIIMRKVTASQVTRVFFNDFALNTQNLFLNRFRETTFTFDFS